MVKPDIVLDTNFLADFLAIFSENSINTGGVFTEKYRIKKVVCQKINSILNCHREIGTYDEGLVIASSFAFIEIVRQFDTIIDGRISLEEFDEFVRNPPEWFFITPIDLDLASYFYNVPEKTPKLENIEWTDAIHIATANSRDPLALLACSDHKIKDVLGKRAVE